MNGDDLNIILNHIRDEIFGVKKSVSQDMDRRNEFLVEKVTNILTEKIQELFNEEIKPLQKQANDNTQDIRFVKRLASWLIGIGAFLGVDKVINLIKSLV